MRSFMSACKQATVPSMTFPGGITFLPPNRKDKVVIVMGATGTGKSRLAIDLAKRFPAEIVNSDKMQVYKGLDITTNKVTHDECQGIRHHLLGYVDPNIDFTADDFRHDASMAVESIVAKHRLPIVAGGSNSYIKALIHDNIDFQRRYSCCFLWVHVSMPVLESFVAKRVDRMVQAGLVDEARRFYNPKDGKTIGVGRAIGVPELDRFFEKESWETLKEAIEKIKANTCQLAKRQFGNIERLQNEMEWDMHQVDATEALVKHGLEGDDAWERLVARPSSLIVADFLYQEEESGRIMSTAAKAIADVSR